jgi:hypothetical protein
MVSWRSTHIAIRLFPFLITLPNWWLIHEQGPFPPSGAWMQQHRIFPRKTGRETSVFPQGLGGNLLIFLPSLGSQVFAAQEQSSHFQHTF